MSGDFEKNISQRMDGFQLTPGPRIWERVAAALPKKRRRRFAIWWLVPLAACLVGSSIWLLPGKQKITNDQQIRDIAHNASAGHSNLKKLTAVVPSDTAGSYTIQPEDNQSKKLILKKQNKVRQTLDIPTREVVVNNYPQKNKQHKEPLQVASLAVIPKADISIYENVLLKRHSQTPANRTEEVDDRLNEAAGQIADKKAIISSSNFLNQKPILPLVDLTGVSLPDVVVKMDTALLIDQDTLLRTAVGNNTPGAKIKNKKPEWSLMVAVGKSSLNNGSSEQQKSLASNYQNTSGGLASSIGTFSNPTNGFSFSAGIRRSQTISKHFNWEAELNYQLLTTKQSIGGRNDSLIQFDASTNRAFYTANRTGNAPGAIRLNQVHRVQIAPGIRYTINPTAHLPVSFYAGASMAYTISNDLLLHDYRSYSYIQSSSLSNKLMLGSQVGIDVFIKYKIHAGLYFQQDFTNVAKAKAGSVFRWNQVQLRIGIPLSKH